MLIHDNRVAGNATALNVSNHKALDTYYAALATYRDKDVIHEQATRLAFSTLLDTISKTAGWTLVLEQTLANRKRPDGTLYDDVKFPLPARSRMSNQTIYSRVNSEGQHG